MTFSGLWSKGSRGGEYGAMSPQLAFRSRVFNKEGRLLELKTGTGRTAGARPDE